MRSIDCIIIGSGPSGLMAANILEESNLNYLVIEKNHYVGRKLAISGGTRCNVTNSYSPSEFIDKLKIKNKRFLFSTLNNFGTKEVVAFFENKGVALSLEKSYQYFPKSSKSQDIINALTKDLNLKNFLFDTKVETIEKTSDGYLVETNNKSFETKTVIIATGSKSYPKTGSTGDGYLWAKTFNHQAIPFYPAETHVYSELVKRNKKHLQGISLNECEVKINHKKPLYKGGLIFTHFGLSGPVIQDISELLYFELLKGKTTITIKLTPHSKTTVLTMLDKKENQNKRIIRIVEKLTIKRLARYLLMILKIDNDKLVSSLSNSEKQQILTTLLQFEVPIDRVEKIENAYVNGGGISTNEINPKTMESKLSEGIYFVGELLNVHGPIGGYNITIALSTGYTAANHIKRRLS